MKMYVITKNIIEGFHRWKDAPETLEHLMGRHRHRFYITCKFSVFDDDREIEIQTMQNNIEKAIRNEYGCPAEFDNMSCEAIARKIVTLFKRCDYCEVLEDNEGGAAIQRKENV